MDERPIDLEPLDPTLDRERWERRIAAIATLAAPELARRAATAAASPALVLLGWFRPALSAAAVLALCAAGALAVLGGSQGAPEPAVAVDALRLPAPVALWLGEDQPPTVADLAVAMKGGPP